MRPFWALKRLNYLQFFYLEALVARADSTNMFRLATFLAILLCALLLPFRDGCCTGINITNVALGALSGGSTTITFDITWTNSWRSTAPGAPAPNNWDAAWVFVKFQKNGGDWAHASLNDSGHATGSGTAATIAVGYPDTGSAFNIATNPGVGVFIHRSGDGTGTFSLTGASLSWNYAQDGVTSGDTVVLRLFGIEMVHIPDGAFFAGDNRTTSSSYKQGSNDNDPWYIGSESAITVTNGAGSGTGVAETAAEYFDSVGYTIPAAFPKGYGRFYMMKGEISQGQWVGFFNTLTSTQKTTRDITASTNGGKNTDDLSFRNNVSWLGSGDATLPDRGGGKTYQGVAMNYLSWGDLTAYLDWSGLRPMSELEFERSARGPYRVGLQYAWGDSTITQATSIVDEGLPTERAQSGANLAYGNHASVQGPLRVGSFAYGVSTRTAAGAGYYGAMELTGNVTERTVTTGNTWGRVFEGRNHGNGALTSSGDSNVTSWPSTTAFGAGARGGDWFNNNGFIPIGQRNRALDTQAGRTNFYGGRGVRTAP